MMAVRKQVRGETAFIMRTVQARYSDNHNTLRESHVKPKDDRSRYDGISPLAGSLGENSAD
ncbi:hypothetical protein LGZ99_06040 [Photorhabdus temperata]|uniref:hypothetical protein n=1 Tax=Photorhabdus temperata TaxID=574560 RepID=UPI00055B1999|nr:hypothetical protein [Photorhabdus temperata]MCT8346783.1 hypothetical protein [Photorhabdus temperata]